MNRLLAAASAALAAQMIVPAGVVEADLPAFAGPTAVVEADLQVRQRVVEADLPASAGATAGGQVRLNQAQTAVQFTDVAREAGIDFRTSTARAPTSTSSRRWARADCSSTTTTTAGSTSSWWTAGRWPTAPSRSAPPSAVPQPRQRHVRRRDASGRASDTASTAWAPAPATTTTTAGWTSTSPTSVPTRSTATAANGDVHATCTRARRASATPKWSASCAFADLDRDGDLDLFVDELCGRRPPAHSPFCGDAQLGHALLLPPAQVPPAAEHALSQRRRRHVHRRQRRVGHRRAIAATASASSWPTSTSDGWPDVFVANDSVPELPLPQHRDLPFTEAALAAGVAVATDGKARAGMGIDTGDYDGDGRLDLVVTNLDFEMHSLYRDLGDGLFAQRHDRERHRVRRRCPSSASASRSSTSTTTRSSTSRSSTATSSTTRRCFESGATYHAAQAAVPEHDGCGDSWRSAARRAGLRRGEGRTRAGHRRHRQRRRPRPARHQQRPGRRAASQRRRQRQRAARARCGAARATRRHRRAHSRHHRRPAPSCATSRPARAT